MDGQFPIHTRYPGTPWGPTDPYLGAPRKDFPDRPLTRLQKFLRVRYTSPGLVGVRTDTPSVRYRRHSELGLPDLSHRTGPSRSPRRPYTRDVEVSDSGVTWTGDVVESTSLQYVLSFVDTGEDETQTLGVSDVHTGDVLTVGSTLSSPANPDSYDWSETATSRPEVGRPAVVAIPGGPRPRPDVTGHEGAPPRRPPLRGTDAPHRRRRTVPYTRGTTPTTTVPVPANPE